MNSRRMERAAGADPAHDLRSALRRPGAGAPARLLVLGRDDAADLTGVAASVVRRPCPEQVDDGPFDAILWTADAASVDAGACRRVRDLLEADGRLVLLGQAAAPAPDGAVTRRLVRALSEAGFVVVKELAPEALVARRDDFVVRPFQPGDEDAVARLFADSFHVERPAAHWRWKYQENPYGGRYASLAWAPGGELACHYAGYPMPFWRDGRAVLGLQMGDTMTAPSWRHVGRGTSSLLARTVRHFFAVHRRGPFAFFYGFNTGGIQRFCRWFIGGSRAEPVCYRARDATAPPGAPPYRVERVARVDRRWDRFFARVAGHYGFLARRDAEYVDWRYLRCPDPLPYVTLAAWRWGRLVGWGVFRRREDRIVWGDALLDPRHAGAAGALLAGALAAPELAGGRRVEGWFPGRPAFLDAELDRLGFESLPHPDGLGLMYLPDGEDDPPLDRLYYTMGDGDLF